MERRKEKKRERWKGGGGQERRGGGGGGERNLTKTFSSVQFSCSVMSDSLRPHELQHTRPPCPSPTPRVHPDSRPSSQ